MRSRKRLTFNRFRHQNFFLYFSRWTGDDWLITMNALEQSLRAYEAAHRRWMNTSVFTPEGQRAKDELKTAREAYETEVRKANPSTIIL